MTAKPTANRHGTAVITTPSDNEILITRQFDAPADLLFSAYTTPDLVKRWWGFETSEWRVCEVDLRVGGSWRYVIVDDGMEVGFHGTYEEINAPRRLVYTEVFEGFPGATADDDGAARVVVTFDEADGVTTMSSLVQHQSREHRDAHLASGMESGMQVSYDRLEDLVRQES
jgi:uncharacterized protein YndB with AHSA1/START domain